MDIPNPPPDISLQNIIDKLAEFVSRNGLEFEAMTKIKQQGNPKFSFLYGGEYYIYYQYKLRQFQQQNQQNQQQQQQNPPALMSLNNNQQQTITAIPQVWSIGNQNTTPQTNGNVAAYTAQIEALNVQQNGLRDQIRQSELNLQAQHGVLLAQQKNQIEEAISRAQTEYIQRLATDNSVSLVELDGILQPIIENCTKDSISHDATEEQSEKLTKLLSLWESKANFFDACVISKLKAPPSSLQEYQNTLLTQHAAVITPLTQATKATYDNYQQQHQAFVQHASQQIALLETQKQQIEQQSLKQQQQPPPLLPELSQQSHQIPSLLSINTSAIVHQKNSSQGGNFFNNQNSNSNFTQYPIPGQGDSQGKADFSLPPPNFPIPDLSRPPPGFDSDNTASEPETDVSPTLPYFELPAGLMVPLIRLEDYNYKPLKPDSIRLPPPTPPNERLLSAVEAFYAPPSHERPRDGEGWEKLALYEYFKVKNASKKQKEEEIASGTRERSRSPTPIPEDMIRPPKKTKKRVYRSKSRSRSRSRSRTPSRSPTPPPERPRKRSKTPPRRPSPPKNQGRGGGYGRDNRNERDRRERSITPPSFSMAGVNTNKQNESIEESNKGHQMLKKMGWTSGGLAGGFGISEPISAGQVRDKQDLYKGVGINLADPYENFRKNKGQAFISRIKSRDERS